MTILNSLRPSAVMAVALLACTAFSLHVTPAHAEDIVPTTADESQQTQAGVMAVENHWTLAEWTGDTAWLNDMLLPEYRSVNDDGAAHPKEAIVAGAAKRRGTSLDEAKAKWAAYQRDHASGSAVVMHGNTAIVSFYDTTLGAQKGVRSSDIFVYVDGHWHALYSQHTAVHG